MNRHPKRSRAKHKRTLKESDIVETEISREKGAFNTPLTKEFGLELRKHILRYLIPLSDGLCKMCKCKMNDIPNSKAKMTIDHILPRSRGGKTTVDNCRLVCLDCNRKKANITCYVLDG